MGYRLIEARLVFAMKRVGTGNRRAEPLATDKQAIRIADESEGAAAEVGRSMEAPSFQRAYYKRKPLAGQQ